MDRFHRGSQGEKTPGMPDMTRLPSGVWPVMLTPFREDGTVDAAGIDALTDWYIDSGASGLFAVSGSSEMFRLTPGERLALAARVVARVRGRFPVVATGGLGGPVEEQAASVRRMAETGVDAVVVVVSGLAAPEEEDAAWRASVERLLARTGSTPLGLYECPSPYHRVLPAETLGWAASTGRFLFHKDTSCRIEAICAKLDAVHGTPLNFFNAHTPTLLDSLRAGGRGYSGIGANYCPELYDRLCHTFASDSRAVELQAFLTEVDAGIFKYPASAKLFLIRGGLPIALICRSRNDTFSETEIQALDQLRTRIGEFRPEAYDPSG